MTTTLHIYASSSLPPRRTLALGRVLLALLFIPAGCGKLIGFSGAVGYIASKGVPLPEVCAAIAIAAELGLGLLLLVGLQGALGGARAGHVRGRHHAHLPQLLGACRQRSR